MEATPIPILEPVMHPVFGNTAERSYNGVISVFVLFVTAYFGSLILMFPSLVILFFLPKQFRQYNDFLGELWFMVPVILYEWLCGVKLVVTGDKVPKTDRVVFIMNHRTRLDWSFLWCYVFRAGRLRNEKIILKKSLKFLPGFGWAMQMFRFLFLSRRWEQDEKWMGRILRSYADSGYPLQLLIFPEGTDYDFENLKRSYTFATKSGVSPFKYLLLPRVRGLQHTISLLRKNLDAVYDLTLAYPDFIPQNEQAFLRGQLPKEVHLNVKRIDIGDIPEGDEGVSRWCMERFTQKEAKLTRFYQEGKFGDEGPVEFADEEDKKKLTMGLVFWSVFLGVTFFLLFASSWFRWYLLFANVTFTVLSYFGGVEKFELDILESKKQS